jgi:hypothetical protein
MVHSDCIRFCAQLRASIFGVNLGVFHRVRKEVAWRGCSLNAAHTPPPWGGPATRAPGVPCNASAAPCGSVVIDCLARALWCVLCGLRLCQRATKAEHSKRHLEQSTQLTSSQLLAARGSAFQVDRESVSCVLGHRVESFR